MQRGPDLSRRKDFLKVIQQFAIVGLHYFLYRWTSVIRPSIIQISLLSGQDLALYQVSQKKRNGGFSVPFELKVLYLFTLLDKASSAEENDTKIIEYG